MVLAVGNEALGQRDKAEEQFLALLKAKPDVADLRAAVAFYLRGGDVAKATPLLHQIIDAPGQTDAEPVLWARRTLALALAASGDYKQSKDALGLLDQNLQERNAPEDRAPGPLCWPCGRAGGKSRFKPWRSRSPGCGRRPMRSSCWRAFMRPIATGATPTSTSSSW